MKVVKFRGKVRDGKFVYGDLLHRDEKSFIRTCNFRYFEIDPESVALLVGHDVEGKEVYEGDMLEDVMGEYTAQLEPVALGKSVFGGLYRFEGKRLVAY